ncbi:MAG: helix-turn-helix domain-containing protein [Stackebrandtia sp.]
MTLLDTIELPKPNVLVLTVEEAAEALRIGRTSMYALIKSGAVKAVLVNGSRRVPVTSLREYIDDLLSSTEAA